MKFSLLTLLLVTVAIAMLVATSMYNRRAAEVDSIYGQPTVLRERPTWISSDQFRKLTPLRLDEQYPGVRWFVIKPTDGFTLTFINEFGRPELCTYRRPVRLSRQSMLDVMASRPVTSGFGLAR